MPVLCPYGEKEHGHGFELPGRRVSHCFPFPVGQYEFILPIDEGTKLVGYEIDKRRARFVNVRLQNNEENGDSNSTEEDEGELCDRFNNKLNLSGNKPNPGPALRLYGDARELETVGIRHEDSVEQATILLAISNCVCGDLKRVKKYLRVSAETHLFLHGKDETGRGDTTLIMAAQEKSSEMVSLLLQHGADVDAVNHHGRSALMEAALWGRIENVKVLLEANANKQLRDHKHRCAMDLARRNRENEEERYWRSNKAASDDPPKHDNNRRHISILLSDEKVDKPFKYTGPLSESQRNKYSFMKDEAEKTISLHGPVASFQVSRISKTAAVLDRGNQFTRISATSGWGDDALPLNYETGPTWTEQVYHIANLVSHGLEEWPNRDRGNPGKYFACHAEKKLIAYFINKHVFLPQDKEPDQKLEKRIRDTSSSLTRRESSSDACQRVRFLEFRKQELELQLLDADDRILGDNYDERKVERLKREIHETEEELSSFMQNSDVIEMREVEKTRDLLFKNKKKHEKLMKLSTKQPPVSLTKVSIMSSNEICGDCETFKNKMNQHFQLNIELSWRAGGLS